jgi:hypothetical protein
MADSEVFTDAMGQGAGLVVSTGILSYLVLLAKAFDPGHADEIRELGSGRYQCHSGLRGRARCAPTAQGKEAIFINR